MTMGIWKPTISLIHPSISCVLQGMVGSNPCCYCAKRDGDQLDHYIHSCTKYVGTRELYGTIVVNNFDVSTSTYLYNLPQDDLTEIILGKHLDAKMAEEQWQFLLEIGARSWQILAYEPEELIRRCM